MKFKQFMDMYDDWNGITKVNDDNLRTIIIGRTSHIMSSLSTFDPGASVKSYSELFDMEVVSFGFYEDEFCVRVRYKNEAVDR